MKYKKILIFFIIFKSIFNINTIILEEKIDINKKLSIANTQILQKKYNFAKTILEEIKYKYSDSEFCAVSNFLLATIEYENKRYYQALFLVESSLSHKLFNNINENYKNRIYYFSGLLNYKLEYFDKAIIFLDKIYLKQDIPRDKAMLIISDIYTRHKKDNKTALFYFKSINKSRLDEYDKDLYDFLSEKIIWKKIDTSKLAFKDPNVSSLLVDKDVIYIATWNGGLIKYNYILENYKFYGRDKIVSENIRVLYSDNRYIYIGTADGLSILDKRSDTFFSPKEMAGISVTTISGNKEKIFIGTLGKGVIEYDKKERIFCVSNDTIKNISHIYCYDNNTIICSYDGVILFYQNDNYNNFIIPYIKNNTVTSVVKSNNTIWFTTHGSGIIKYNLDSKKFDYFNNKNIKIIDNYILCSALYSDKIFFGTLGKGILEYDNLNNNWKMINISELYSTLDIYSIVIFNNNLFIGTLGEGVFYKEIIEK